MTPFTKTAAAQGVSDFVALLRHRAKTQADQAKLNGLMAQACSLRAARECTAAEFDKFAGKFAASTLAIARQGACL